MLLRKDNGRPKGPHLKPGLAMPFYKVHILSTAMVTHNVRSFRVEKPAGYRYTPGQATELSVQKIHWEQEKRPFTFTSLPEEDTLEFTIKMYADHDGVTNQLRYLQTGDEFEIGDAWGTIEYKGPGIFIAGGAGITPFIAILRHLHRQGRLDHNRLIFSNKTEQDIILKEELTQMLGSRLTHVITRQEDTLYHKGKIDKAFLQEQIPDFSQHFYVCGPDAFTQAVLTALQELGAKADTLVFEQ